MRGGRVRACTAQIAWEKDEFGKIIGYVKEIGQTKVDRLQIGERKAQRCPNS